MVVIFVTLLSVYVLPVIGNVLMRRSQLALREGDVELPSPLAADEWP
jgi:hypothetical protein